MSPHAERLRSTPLALLVLLLVPVAIFGSMGLADAKKGGKAAKLSVEKGTKTISAPGTGSMSVQCKGTASLVGLGFDTTYPKDDGLAFAHRIAPTTRRLNYEGTGVPIDSPPPPAKALAYAYCAKGIKTSIRTASIPNEAGTVDSVVASCSGKQKVLGGGFATVNTIELNGGVLGSHRAGKKGWLVQVYAGQSVGNTTAYAICAKGVKVKEVEGESGVPTVTGVRPAPIPLTARCARKFTLLSGGYEAGVPDGPSSSQVPTAIGSLAAGKRNWKVRAMAAGGTNTHAMTSYAYCVKRL